MFFAEPSDGASVYLADARINISLENLMNVVTILHNIFLRHVKVKIFAVLIAFFLWFYVVTDNTFVHTVSIPLFVINKSPDKVLTRPVPQYASVEVRGSGKDIIRLLYSNKKIDLDIGGVSATRTFPLDLDMIVGIPANSGIEPLNIVSPKEVSIELDQFISKKVPVVSNFYLEPLAGYIQVGPVKLDPDSVVVSGPEAQVETVASVSTDSVSYDKIIKDFSGEVALARPENSVVDVSCRTVSFNADFQRIGERIFRHIPVRIIHVPQGVSALVVPSTMTLKLQGGAEVLSGIDKSMIRATIDYRSRYRYPQKRLSAVIQLPDNIITYEAKPQFFEIIVE